MFSLDLEVKGFVFSFYMGLVDHMRTSSRSCL